MPIPSIGFGGIGRGGGTLSGAPPSNWSAAYGGVPQVPSPGASQGAALGSNLSNLSRILSLAGGVNTFNDQAAVGTLRSAIPGYDNLVASSSQNILKEIQGDIPNDVVNEILQHAAERGILTGTVGSDNNNAALMRALGINSIEQRQRGEQNLTNAIARTPRGQHANPEAFMVSPDAWQEAQMASNLYASAPVPKSAATASLGSAARGLQAGIGAAGGGVAPRATWTGGEPDRYAASRVEASYPAIWGQGNPDIQDPVDPYASWFNSTFGTGATFGTSGAQSHFYAGPKDFLPTDYGSDYE